MFFCLKVLVIGYGSIGKRHTNNLISIGITNIIICTKNKEALHLEAGIYIKHLKRWMELFPRNQFLIVKSEDLFKNTTSTYNRVLQFLGLPNYELDEYKKFKERKHKKLDVNMREKLNNLFQPHNEQLYKFLGTDFAWE